MTQIIVVNDTGAKIDAASTITLDGVNAAPPIKKIRNASLVNLYNGSTTAAPAATPTALAETASAPTSGNYAYLESENEIKLGVDMQTYQILVLDVLLVNEIVRT